MNDSKTTSVPLDAIRMDGGTQPRAVLCDDTIAAYAADLEDGATFPPVSVFFDGTEYWLGDGFHRVEAHRLAGVKSIPADVRQGTKRDAILHSVGANADHGLRRSNEDKRRAVSRLLTDAEWNDWSDRTIAKLCAVSNTLVSELRKEAHLSKLPDATAARTVSRGGKTYGMSIDGIRKAAKKRTAAKSMSQTPAPAAAIEEEGVIDNVTPPPGVGQPGADQSKSMQHVDATGEMIEQDKVREAFAAIPRFQELADLITELKRRAHSLINGPAGVHMDINDVNECCTRLRSHVLHSTPHAVCRSCGGTGCAACAQSGFLSKFKFDTQVPGEMK